MSRRSVWSALVAAIVVLPLSACRTDSPVAPEPEAVETAGDAQPMAKAPQPVPDEYIVIFRDDRKIPPGLAKKLGTDLGFSLKHEYSHVVSGFAAKIPPQALNGLRNNPFIERIEPNLTYTLEAPIQPPGVPTAGLRVRLVADDLSPGDVEVWPNRGSDGDATQPDASRRPGYRAPDFAFGGHASVGFNEGGDNDEVLEIGGVNSHASATVIAVLQQEDANNHNYGLATMYGSRKSRASAVTHYTRGDAVEYWDTESGWSDGTVSLTPGQTYVVVWRVDGGNVADLQVDGADAGSGNLSGPIPAFDRYLFGMTEPSTKSRFDGWLAELLIYDRILDDCDRDGVVADLGQWYGVTLAPGFQPCGQTGSPPATPQGLQAAATGSASIGLTWIDTSADETGFIVERSLGFSGPWSQVATVPAGTTAFDDADLDASTEYCYRVAAFNASGSSGYTADACATTEAPGPLPPPIAVPTPGLRVRLVANDLSGGDVTSWPNRGSEADATQSDPGRRPTWRAPGVEFGGQASVSFNEGSDNDEALEIGGVASHGSGTLFAVFRQEDKSSHNYGLFAPWGSSGSRASMVTAASSAGGDFVYWDSSNGWSSGTVSLVANETYVGVWRVADGIDVQLSVNGSPAGSTPLASPVPSFDRYVIGMSEPSTSSRFDGWVAELLYYDRALAGCEIDQISADLGARYGVSMNVTGGPCSPPADPTSLNVAAVGSTAVDLDWDDASSNEDGFRIERRPGPSGSWEEVAVTPANVEVYSDAGLSPDTEYCYRVNAFNEDGASGFTNAACATTENVGPLPPPVIVPASGLRVRLIANDLSTGDVSVWPNRGSEGDASQTVSTRRPVYHAPSSDFGGNAAVGFNEGSDNDEALEIAGVTSHGGGTLLAVFRQEGTAGHNYGIFGLYGSSSSRAGMVTRASSTGGPVDYWDSANGWVNGATVLSGGETYIATWTIADGGTAALTVNGDPAGSGNFSSGVPGFDRYVVGMSEPSTSSRFDGRIAELLLYDHPLPHCARDQIVADLGARYGVVVSTSGGGGCNPPAGPTGLAATAAGYDGVDLAWTDASSNEDGFRIERRVGQAGAWQQIAETGPDVTSYESRGLIQQTEYCYRVLAFNGDGTSADSNVDCATTEAGPPGACVDSGNHDDLTDLYGIVAIGAPANQAWASTQVPGCEIRPWYFGIDSGIDSDHPDLNVVEALNFVAAEPNRSGEDGNGHGTHTAGTAAARDGNGGVVGVAPGAPIYSFRVCEDGGSCQTADMVAAMDSVMGWKANFPDQPMVANMSIGGPVDEVIDLAIRNSINAGIVYAVAAGNGILGACIFPQNSQSVSPARTGDDEIDASGGSAGDDGVVNGVLTTTSHNASFADVNCNYGHPVSVAAPGYNIRSTWLNGGYNTISGTSMATPHAAGAALLYLQEHPDATPSEVEAAIVSRLQPWTTNESPSASGRLFVDGL